jgi:hypothetical protein
MPQSQEATDFEYDTETDAVTMSYGYLKRTEKFQAFSGVDAEHIIDVAHECGFKIERWIDPMVIVARDKK